MEQATAPKVVTVPSHEPRNPGGYQTAKQEVKFALDHMRVAGQSLSDETTRAKTARKIAGALAAFLEEEFSEG